MQSGKIYVLDGENLSTVAYLIALRRRKEAAVGVSAHSQKMMSLAGALTASYVANGISLVSTGIPGEWYVKSARVAGDEYSASELTCTCKAGRSGKLYEPEAATGEIPPPCKHAVVAWAATAIIDHNEGGSSELSELEKEAPAEPAEQDSDVAAQRAKWLGRDEQDKGLV